MRALALPSSKYGRLVLWDSQGVKQSNQIYVDMMVKYLGDKYNELTGHPAEACTRPWRKIDDSGNSPRQSNGYDCGIFTLTSISLLAQQTPLTTRSYTEAEFQLQDTRKRIAFLLWQASRNQPRPRQRSRSATSSRTPPLIKSTTLRPRKTSSRHTVTNQSSRFAAKERNKRRRQRSKQNLVLGGTRTRGKIHSSDLAQTQQLTTLIRGKPPQQPPLNVTPPPQRRRNENNTSRLYVSSHNHVSQSHPRLAVALSPLYVAVAHYSPPAISDV
jgi:hypothetical protein